MKSKHSVASNLLLRHSPPLFSEILSNFDKGRCIFTEIEVSLTLKMNLDVEIMRFVLSKACFCNEFANFGFPFLFSFLQQR